jgi:hypothetical protein
VGLIKDWVQWLRTDWPYSAEDGSQDHAVVLGHSQDFIFEGLELK